MEAPARWVIVDDADTSISYTGSWFSENGGGQHKIGNFGTPYLETLHGISEDGSISLEFNGVSYHPTLLNFQ